MKYKTEADIYKAGGRIAENYRGLKNYLDNIYKHSLEPLCALGMASNKEEYLYYSHKYSMDVRRDYVAKQVDKIALKIEEAVKEADSEGREYKGIPIIDKYATSKTGKNKGLPFAADILHDGEKLRRKITQKIVQKLNQKFAATLDEVYKRTWYKLEHSYRSTGEDIFFDSIRFSPEEGLTIDIPSFAEIYRSQTEAEQSETYKKHLAAAEAVNSFFGNMEITDKEMERYFQLYGGKVRPNPKSVNVESYMRLKW
jgi:hypothetical protein